MRFARAALCALLMVTFGGWPTAGQDPDGHPKVAQALELARVWLEAQRAYAGSYASTFSRTETAIVAWDDGLAMLPVPTTDPMGSLTKFRKTGEHTFRRVRDDGALGEPIVFEMGPDGKALRYVQHSNPYERRR